MLLTSESLIGLYRHFQRGPNVITRCIRWVKSYRSRWPSSEEWWSRAGGAAWAPPSSGLRDGRAEERGQSGPVSSHRRHRSHPNVPSARHTWSQEKRKLQLEDRSTVAVSWGQSLCSPSSTRSGFNSSSTSSLLARPFTWPVISMTTPDLTNQLSRQRG